jgi:Transcriptional regulator
MALKEALKLAELDSQLHKGETGDCVDLSKRLGISRSSLYNLFNELKKLGAVISYNPKEKTYYYQKRIKVFFYIGFDNGQIMGIKDIRKVLKKSFREVTT